MSKKHALIIGINAYPHYLGDKYQLKGCVNDALLIKSLLITKFNFNENDIISLTDKAATRDAIIKHMDALADKIERDDIVVFHFSGHGHTCKVRTAFSDEGSGKINSIVPHDDSEPAPIDPVLAPEGKIWREIREHTINQWLQRIAKKTRYTTLIFDACHSGTMTRSNEPSNVRSIPQEVRRQVIESISTSESATAAKPKKGSWLTLSDNFVVISGCRDTQLSKERYFSEGTQQYKHGVLTYSLCGALQNATPETTYRDIFEKVTADVVSRASDQNPQIEGSIDRVVFGVKDIEPLSYLPVSAVNQNQIILNGGAAQGVRIGSKWAIYPPFTKHPLAENRLGSVKVTEVGALSSITQLLENTEDIPVGARCIAEDFGYSPNKLRIDLSRVTQVSSSELIHRIQKSQLLALAANSESGDIYAQIIDHVSQLPESLTTQQSQRISLPVWAFYEGQDNLCMPLHEINKPAVAKLLFNNLEKIARFKNLMQLDNLNTTLQVEFNLFKRLPDDSLELANGGITEFIDGTTPMVIELKNNEAERTVFFSILWLSANREVSTFYPFRKSSEELSPGRTIRIGLGNRRLTASLAVNYTADIGSESCKAMFSSAESDFSWLNQEGVRSNSGSGSNAGSKSNVAAFDAALIGDQNANNDIQNPDEQTQTNIPSPDDWDAISRSFTIVRNNR